MAVGSSCAWGALRASDDGTLSLIKRMVTVYEVGVA
jgi:hypothetical protein